MSDHYTTQSNHKKHVMEALRMVQDYTVLSKYSHRRYLNRLKVHVWDSNSWSRLTQYNQAYVSGRADQWQAQIEREHHEWRVYHPDLGYIHSKRDPDVLKGRWPEVVPGLGASFWIGTNKLWSADPEYVFTIMDMYPDEHEHEREFWVVSGTYDAA